MALTLFEGENTFVFWDNLIISSLVAVACIFFIFMGFFAPSYGWLNGIATPGAIGYVNGCAYPAALTYGVISLVIFACLMIYSGFYVKDLSCKSPRRAILFSVIMLTLSLITFVFLWVQFRIYKIEF